MQVLVHFVGDGVGAGVGLADGEWVGSFVGEADGTWVGLADGEWVGSFVGEADGTWVGAGVGAAVAPHSFDPNLISPLFL
jgi:hypothetical protein